MSTYHDPTDPDTTHMYVGVLDGTSMAAPHVCGVAALLESHNSSLTRQQKIDLMVNHTTPFAPANTKQLGPGILNATPPAKPGSIPWPSVLTRAT